MSRTSEAESNGVNSTGCGMAVETFVTRTITEVGVLLNCMVKLFDGKKKFANVPLRVPAVRTVKESLTAGENPLVKSTLSAPFNVTVPAT